MDAVLRVAGAAAIGLLAAGSTPAAAHPKRNACALITASEASRVLGTRVTSAPAVGRTSCSLGFRVRGSSRPSWLVANVNPNRTGTRCCSPEGALRRFRGSGAKITMVSTLGASAFAAALRLPNGSLYEQVVAVRHGRLFVLQGERSGASLEQMVALALVACQRL